MPLRFRPMDRSFYDLISESASNLVGGAELLAEMLPNVADRQDIAKQMREAEHECDETTHAHRPPGQHHVRHPVRPRGHLPPRGRRSTTSWTSWRRPSTSSTCTRSSELPDELANLVDVLQRSAELTAEAMPRLRTMRDLQEYWIEINRLENEGDKPYRRILAKLFSGQYDALTVMKLKDVVDALEAAIDAFETVANIVEQIAVKES